MEPNDNKWKWSQALFEAIGILAFTVPAGTELPSELAQWATTTAHRLHPWISTYANGNPAPSTEFISELTCKEGEVSDERTYELWFRPPRLLNPGQLAAYYNHVLAVAGEVSDFLSAIPEPRVLTVTGRIDLHGVAGGASTYRRTRRAHVRELHSDCSLQVRQLEDTSGYTVNNCNQPAEAAVIDPVTHSKLFRCSQHRDIVRYEPDGSAVRGDTVEMVTTYA